MNRPFPHSLEGTGNYVSHLDKLAVTLAVYSKAVFFFFFFPKQVREFEEKKHTPGYAQSAVFCGRNSTVNSKERKVAFLQERRKRKCSGRVGEGMHLATFNMCNVSECTWRLY